MEYTEEELAQLTDEEREALLADDDEGTDDEGEGDDAGDGAADDHDDGDDGDGDDEGDDEGDADDDDHGDAGEDGEGEGEADAAEAADADAGEGAAKADADDAGAAEQQAPQQAPVDFNAALESIEAKIEAIEEKYDEGELTSKERRQQVRELEDQRVSLIVAQREAVAAAQRAHDEQNRTVDSFLAEVGIPRDDNDPRFAAYDKCVIKVANDPASAQLSARAILEKAHALYSEQFGIAAKAPAKDKPAKPVKPRVEVPPTLGKVPAAAHTPTDEGNRFAWLDRLDPVTREAEVAKLSAADLDAYLTYS